MDTTKIMPASEQNYMYMYKIVTAEMAFEKAVSACCQNRLDLILEGLGLTTTYVHQLSSLPPYPSPTTTSPINSLQLLTSICRYRPEMPLH